MIVINGCLPNTRVLRSSPHSIFHTIRFRMDALDEIYSPISLLRFRAPKLSNHAPLARNPEQLCILPSYLHWRSYCWNHSPPLPAKIGPFRGLLLPRCCFHQVRSCSPAATGSGGTAPPPPLPMIVADANLSFARICTISIVR